MDTLILQALESVRCPFLTAIFCLFTFLGDELLLTAVIAVVYYAINKKRGETLMMAALSSAGINGAIKDAVRRPRPFQKGVVKAVKVENLLASTTSIEGSYSFPSGHSMNAGGFYGAFASSLRKKAVYAVCAVILLLVMTSRLYLGVHYPSDVLCGALLGVGVGIFWAWMNEKHTATTPYIYLAVGTLLCVSLFWAESEDSFKAVGSIIGSAVGLIIERRYIQFEMPKKWWKAALRVALGVAIILGLKAGLKVVFPNESLFHMLRYFLVMGAATGVVPFLFKPLKI